MKKTIIFGTLLFTLLSCADTETKDSQKEENKKTSVLLPLVRSAKVQNTSFNHKISIQGNIETTQDILINSEMSGMIENVAVSAGTQVKAGAVLLTMDAAILNANIRELKSQLDFAQYMLGQQEKLFEQNLGSEFDKKSAENQVNSLEAKLNTMEVQLSKMIVRAPFSGKIDQVYAKAGQLSGPQMPLMRLVNMSNTEVVASVSEKHFKSIKKGTKLTVNFPNYQLEPITTKVSSVGSYIEPTNRTFTIRAEINNKIGLMPNMLTELEIIDFEIESGLVIPSKSILKNAKSEDYIWVLEPAKKESFSVQQVFINKLKAYDGQALIEQNDLIKEGTLIIEGGARGITKKDLVRIK